MNDNNTTLSSKRTNNEIVKSLIIMMQTFVDQQDPDASYAVTIDEHSLVPRVGLLIRAFQRQQDRIADLMDGMQKIVSGK